MTAITRRPATAAARWILLAVFVISSPSEGAEPGDLLRYQSRSDAVAVMSAAQSPPAEVRALHLADVTGDGAPDLLVGRTGSSAGSIGIHPGRDGFELTPFQPLLAEIDLLDAVDLLTGGDFDRDGHTDLIAASRSARALWWVRGLGGGAFDLPVEIRLPGYPTALVAGTFDVHDGLDDLAVAVEGANGSSVIVWRSRARGPIFASQLVELTLPAPATDLALSDLVGGPGRDLAVAAGRWLVLLPGRDRLQSGALPEADDSVSFELGFEAVSLAAGDFLGRRVDHRDLAVLSNTGAVTVLFSAGSSDARLRERDGEPAERSWTWQRADVELGDRALSAALGEDRLSGPVELLSVRHEASGTDGLLLAGGSEAEIVAFQAAGSATEDVQVSPETTTLRPVARRVLATGGGPTITALLDRDGLSDVLSAGAGGGFEVAMSASGLTLLVDSTGDDADHSAGDGVCDIDDSAGDGPCTLRAAIQESNATAGADTIHFNVPRPGPIVLDVLIFPSTSLPPLADTVTIEGPNLQAGVGVVLSGVSFGGGSGVDGLTLSAGSDNSVLRDLTLFGWPTGVKVWASNVLIEGSRFRNNGSGSSQVLILGDAATVGGNTAAKGNVVVGGLSTGVSVPSLAGAGNLVQGNSIGIEDGSENGNPRGVVVGRSADVWDNLISGNSTGIRLNGPATLWGNRIGTTADGGGAVPNGSGSPAEAAIAVEDGGDGALIGGTSSALANVLAGATDPEDAYTLIRVGTLSSPGASINGVTIQGNFIGTDVTGTSALGATFGVRVREADNVVIGGAVAGAGNLISGNKVGIWLEAKPGSKEILGNLIGTDASGTSALGNDVGIVKDGEEPGTVTIGGPGLAGNVISGNQSHGISIAGAFVNVAGNEIGSAGGMALGNGGEGISILGDSTTASYSLEIGGSLTPNTIAYNAGAGVAIEDYGGNNQIEIRRNSIHSNGGLGIDLGAPGVQPNDSRDLDTGANGLLNYPSLDGAYVQGETVTVSGIIESDPNNVLKLDFYRSPSCDPSGHGEGQIHLGFTNVLTDNSGVASFQKTFSEIAEVAPVLTATTAKAAFSIMSTSEFSPCLDVVECPSGPLDLVLSDPETGVSSYEACRRITSTSTITATADVVYEAGTVIVFDSGFTVESGATFQAGTSTP